MKFCVFTLHAKFKMKYLIIILDGMFEVQISGKITIIEDEVYILVA